MTPLDDELRTLFHDRADAVPPATDPLAGVQSRARTLRRRRSTGAALACTTVVVAIAVAVPTGLSALRGADAPAPGFLGGTGSSAPAAPAPAGATLGWGVQRDAALAASMSGPALALWKAQHPAAVGARLEPLFARGDSSSEVLLAQVVGDPGGTATIVAVTGDRTTMELYYDQPTPAGTTQVSAIVPAATDSGTSLVIVTDPAVETRFGVTSGADVLLSNVMGPVGELALPAGTVPSELSLRFSDGAGALTDTGPVTYDGTPSTEPPGSDRLG